MLKIKKTQNNLFESSTIFKKIFSLLSFLPIFIVSLILLFQIKDIPKDSREGMNFLWIILILFTIWYISSISHYNLHISHQNNIISYFFSIAINIYIYIYVFLYYKLAPIEWFEFMEIYYLLLTIPIISIIWRFFIIFFEYKTRPIFIKKFFIQTIIMGLLFVLFEFSRYFIQKFLIDLEKWNYLEPFNIFMYLTSGIIIFWIIILFIYKNIKFNIYDVYEKLINKQIIFWNLVLKLSSITIWFLFSIQNLDFNYKEIIFLIFALILMIFNIIFVILKIKKIYIDNYLLSTTTFLFIIIITAFIFINYWTKTNAFIIIAIVLSYTFLYQFINILVPINVSRFFIWGYKILTYNLILYTLFIWGSIFLTLDVKILPFNIYETFSIMLGTAAAFIEFAVLYSYFIKFIRISYKSKKFHKYFLKKNLWKEN